jgi:hypothetical protein
MRRLRYVLGILLGALVIREVVGTYLWLVKDERTLKDLDSVTIKNEFIKEAYTYRSWLFRLLNRLGVRLRKSHTTGAVTFTVHPGDTPEEVRAKMLQALATFDDHDDSDDE